MQPAIASRLLINMPFLDLDAWKLRRIYAFVERADIYAASTTI